MENAKNWLILQYVDHLTVSVPALLVPTIFLTSKVTLPSKHVSQLAVLKVGILLSKGDELLLSFANVQPERSVIALDNTF